MKAATITGSCPLIKNRERTFTRPLPRLQGRTLATFLAFGLGLLTTATMVTLFA